MLIELTQLLKDGAPRSVSQISQALTGTPSVLLAPMLERLERSRRIERCAPQMPCSSGSCSCSQLDEPWYQWCQAQPIRL